MRFFGPFLNLAGVLLFVSPAHSHVTTFQDKKVVLHEIDKLNFGIAVLGFREVQ
jgi:hypothetical protein